MSHEDREGDIYQQEQIAKAQVALLKGEIEAVTPCRLCWEPATADGDGLCALHRTRGAEHLTPVVTPDAPIDPNPKPKPSFKIETMDEANERVRRLRGKV